MAVVSSGLHTHQLLHLRLGMQDVSCVLCVGGEEEILAHLFQECPFIRAMAFASKWGIRLDLMEEVNWMEWFYQSFQLPMAIGQVKRKPY